MHIRLCTRANISLTHLTLASPRTRNCCKPGLRACAHSVVAARCLPQGQLAAPLERPQLQEA